MKVSLSLNIKRKKKYQVCKSIFAVRFFKNGRSQQLYNTVLLHISVFHLIMKYKTTNFGYKSNIQRSVAVIADGYVTYIDN